MLSIKGTCFLQSTLSSFIMVTGYVQMDISSFSLGALASRMLPDQEGAAFAAPVLTH
jgi:hypothetical protein